MLGDRLGRRHGQPHGLLLPMPRDGGRLVTKMFNVRVDETLGDAIDAAAEGSGLKKSVWAREVLGAVALGGVTLDDLTRIVAERGVGAGLTPHPARYLALGHLQGRREPVVRGCVHPETARKHLPFSVVCGLCGEVLKKTL